MERRWISYWLFVGICNRVIAQSFEGTLLDLSGPVTATASSFYVIDTSKVNVMFAPQLAIQADTGRVTNTCFLSKKEPRPWFKIQFKSMVSIFNIRLVVRNDTFSYLPDDFVLSGMDNLTVYISNSSSMGDFQLCNNSWKYVSTTDILMDCGDGLKGKFVYVMAPSASPVYLLICSIVFNRENGPIWPIDLIEVKAAVAASGFGSSSRVAAGSGSGHGSGNGCHSDGYPTFAVDGLLSSREDVCSVLTGTSKTWLRIDIQTVRYIKEIRFLLYSAFGTTTTTVYIGRSMVNEGFRDNTLCGSVLFSRNDNECLYLWTTVTCILPILGQIIYTESLNDSLIICKIEVFYDNVLNVYSPVNITASDQFRANGPVWKPVDGVKALSTRDSWLSLSNGGSWWGIELESEIIISGVIIYPGGLTSLQRDRMDGFSVSIGDSVSGSANINALCGQPWQAPSTSPITEIRINCVGGLVGKYLYVTAPDRLGATLYIGEISIYGCEKPTAMITGGISQQVLQSWQSTNFTCTGTLPGCNVTKIVWMGPDGIEITANENVLNGRLFSNIVVNGSTFGGIYTCTITYLRGSSSTHIEVRVNAEVQVIPPVVTVIEGQLGDSSFQCVTDGYPMPNITWKKNGASISDGVTNRKYPVVNRCGKDITIGNVSLLDNETVYTCEVRQGSFVANSSGILVVEHDFSFTSTPQPTKGIVDNDVTFTCGAKGLSAELIEWTVENKKVHSGFEYQITSVKIAPNTLWTNLTIRSLQLSHGSLKYRCTGGTKAIPNLQVSAPATVSVLGVISSFPDQVYNFEESLETQEPFSCIFTANPTPDAMLQLNSTNVSETSVAYMGSNQYNITFSATFISMKDTGIYSCVVSFCGSSVNISSTALLQVIPRVTLQPDTTINIISPITIQLTCIALGYPLPTITWKRVVGHYTDNITNASFAIDYDNRQTLSTLTYENASISEAGDYTCLASSTLNNGTSVTSLSPVTVVQVSAKVLSHVTSVNATWGSSTNLSCIASGYPPPVVTWKFGDEAIIEGVSTAKSSLASSSYLYLANLSAVYHGGRYKCEAGNTVGPRDSVDFNIYFEPEVVLPSASVAATYGKELKLTCQVVSFPTVDQVIWYKNGQRISNHTDSFVTINQTAVESIYRATTTDDVCGNYSCYSLASQATTVTVISQPVFDTKRLSVVQGETVSLNCTADGCPTPSIMWKFRGLHSSKYEGVDGYGNIQVQSEVINSNRSYSELIIANTDLTNQGSYLCVASNGKQEFSAAKMITVTPAPPPSTGTDIPWYIIVSMVAVSVIAIILVILAFGWKRICRRTANVAEKIEMDNYKGEQFHNTSPWLEEWPRYENLQFDRLKLEFIKELGEGEFGTVFSAVASGIISSEESTQVAVKTLKGGSSMKTAKEFQKELEVMMEFDHPNIIRLLGVCTTEEPLYLITELMDKGDLKRFVSEARPSEINTVSCLTLYELIHICSQVALGLAYLASMKFIHRDIAARNCLVGGGDDNTELVVKVADFGMAKDVYQSDYYKKRGGVLPLRWMAPEALTDGKHTVKSDIWSFGVLMWEVFSYGYQPYFGVDNEVVLVGVIGHYMVLQCPPGCPEIVYHLMKRCWERRPEDRISASEVSKQLLGLARMCKENGFDDVKQITADNYENLQASYGISAEGASNRYVTMLSTATEEDDGYLKPTEVVKTMEVNNLSTFSNLPQDAAENTNNRNTTRETVSSDDGYVHMIQSSPRGGAVKATQRKAILNNTGSQRDGTTAFVGVVEETRCIDMHAAVSQESLRGRFDPASSYRELHSTAAGARTMPQNVAMANGEAKDTSETTVL